MTNIPLNKLPMTLEHVVSKYGHPRDTITVGDTVLLECSNSNQGAYIVLSEVIEVSEDTVKLRSSEAYYPTGQVSTEVKDSEVARDYFKDSINVRLQKNSAFFKEFVNELRGFS